MYLQGVYVGSQGKKAKENTKACMKLAGKGGGRKGRDRSRFDQNPMCIYKTLSLKVINEGGVQACPSALTDRRTCDRHTLIVSVKSVCRRWVPKHACERRF